MPVIYSITNRIDGKRYIGKTTNYKRRWWMHKYNLKKKIRNKNQTNLHLFNAVKKHGLENFKFEILEEIETTEEGILKETELKWMDFYQTCDRNHGYNLRRDSATNCFVHEETKKLMSELQTGENNGNYGNKWSHEQKEKMSQIATKRHASGLFYTESWKKKMSINSTEIWKDTEKRKAMGAKVKIAKRKYFFNQYTKEGVFIKTWDNVEEIILHNPGWKWQNIYSVCNGYKPTYQGFIWKKIIKKEATVKTNNIKGIDAGYKFDQYTKNGEFIRRWGSYAEIRHNYPNKNCGNIYLVCNGKSPSALGFVWKKVIENE